ncbi:6-aminohexanoate-dimer hydrolase [Methylopila turkensis]|uniref:6-aminohexanoate-dimer hydrolase n=2 Tax=Methylopila turkensis TaxID=1437816 RepID=A0A9W6N6E9_9HYPH|nr:6-aminohexanoate-dimer hydrolase [Methylopila turkensis]
MTPPLTRRAALSGAAAMALAPVAARAEVAVGGAPSPRIAAIAERAGRLPQLHALIVARHGRPLFERAFRGPALDRPVNVKSVSKTVLALIAGAAIDRGALQGVDQPVAPLLRRSIPDDADPRVERITIGNLLSLRAGLERTSGPNYGAWISSRNWVRDAIGRPFDDEPGGRMLYSTGSSHLLSAALTAATGRSTLELARDWLGEPLGVTIPPWPRDPQGIYFGGNDMELSPRALLRIGEMARNRGTFDGRRVLSEGWIDAMWRPQGFSPFTGDSYGYGWFLRDVQGAPMRYGWGYGGQMLFVAPDLGLTAVVTSDATRPSGRASGYVDELHALFAEIVGAARADDASKA